jgi:hypothetical protein
VQEDDFVAARLHRHPHLLNRRQRMEPLSVSKVHTHSMLKEGIKSRLVFAVLRRVLQMDALGSNPHGVEILAFKDLAQSRRILPDGAGEVQCQISLPKPVLLPLLDELLCSYDHYRARLWPIQDPVLQYLAERSTTAVSQSSSFRRAAAARVALAGFTDAMQTVMTKSILGQLRPAMLLSWTLHLAETQVCSAPSAACPRSHSLSPSAALTLSVCGSHSHGLQPCHGPVSMLPHGRGLHPWQAPASHAMGPHLKHGS